jgi:hypothetical protein
MGKREPQIILKTDELSIVLEGSGVMPIVWRACN